MLARLAAIAVLAGAPALARADERDPALVSVARDLCRALAVGDHPFVVGHVRFPLRVRTIVDENAGNPRYRSTRVRTPGALARLRLCDGLSGLDPSTTEHDVRVERSPRGWRLITPVGQFDAVLEFARTPSGPVLVEVTR